MPISLVWVIGFVSFSNQASAYGYLVGMARDIRERHGDKFMNHLLLTNDTLDIDTHRPWNVHHRYKHNEVIHFIEYWCNRFSINQNPFDFVTVHQGPCELEYGKNGFGGWRKYLRYDTRTIFFISVECFHSHKVMDIYRSSGFKTAYCCTAPCGYFLKEYDLICNSSISHKLQLKSSSCNSSVSWKVLLPARYPTYFGYTSSNEEQIVFNTKDDETLGILITPTTLTSFNDELFTVLFKQILINQRVRLYLVGFNNGICHENLRSVEDATSAIIHINSLLSSEQAYIYPRVEDFPDLLRNHIDIFFKGMGTGSGTTAALCVNLGIIVIDNFKADSKMFLQNWLLCNDQTHMIQMLNRCISDDLYRDQIRQSQLDSLRSTNQTWDIEFINGICSIMTDSLITDGDFLRGYSRVVPLENALSLSDGQ